MGRPPHWEQAHQPTAHPGHAALPPRVRTRGAQAGPREAHGGAAPQVDDEAHAGALGQQAQARHAQLAALPRGRRGDSGVRARARAAAMQLSRSAGWQAQGRLSPAGWPAPRGPAAQQTAGPPAPQWRPAPAPPTPSCCGGRDGGVRGAGSGWRAALSGACACPLAREPPKAARCLLLALSSPAVRSPVVEDLLAVRLALRAEKVCAQQRRHQHCGTQAGERGGRQQMKGPLTPTHP